MTNLTEKQSAANANIRRLLEETRVKIQRARNRHEEWDFSPLMDSDEATQQTALDWELEREADVVQRGTSNRKPWLQLPEQEQLRAISAAELRTLRAVVRLRLPIILPIPLRELDTHLRAESLGQDHPENGFCAFYINWQQVRGEAGIKKLAAAFATWARRQPVANRPVLKKGHPVDPVTGLSRLSYYRLVERFDLTYDKGARALLESTGYAGGHLTTASSFSNAVDKGRKAVQEAANRPRRFKKFEEKPETNLDALVQALRHLKKP